ncbi:hypothetical protein [Magnetospirillum moscoviense]|nr:hypothetical protein [Magnetospirillum moscoviense]
MTQLEMNRRTVIAFAVSPIAAVVAVFVLIAPISLSAALLSAGIGAIVSYSVALAFGIPCHVLMVKASVRTSTGYVAAGFILGSVVPTSLFLFSGETFETATDYFIDQLPSWTILSGIFGLLGGLNSYVFWRMTRPDRRVVEGT